jgi:uncharacterized protein
MKVLAFTDIHSKKKYFDIIKKKTKKHNPDLLICSGDITYFGLKTEMMIKLLDSLDKTVLVIHGNEDDSDKIKILCSKSKNLKYLHKKSFSYGDYLFLGYGGLGFSQFSKDLENFMLKNNIKNKKIVLITHQPPFETKLDKIPYFEHVGNESITKVIKKIKPILGISGHIHETFRKKDKIGKTLIVNPGEEGMILNI